jgi:hypothetical protein
MSSGKFNIRNFILILFTLLCTVLLFSREPIPQAAAYHNFGDHRSFFGISNFFNVITNVPFIVIGFCGLFLFLRDKENKSDHLLAHYALFVGIAGIGVGSAWYHYHPDNASLVWDRLPMTITFMSYFALIVRHYINRRLGEVILIPLLVVGIASVFYWYRGELQGAGDLRLYAFVQFYPMLAIPLIIFMYPASLRMRLKIISVILIYVVAKVAEHEDVNIFSFHHWISGHSLKHLFASAAVWQMMISLRDR